MNINNLNNINKNEENNITEKTNATTLTTNDNLNENTYNAYNILPSPEDLEYWKREYNIEENQITDDQLRIIINKNKEYDKHYIINEINNLKLKNELGDCNEKLIKNEHNIKNITENINNNNNLFKKFSLDSITNKIDNKNGKTIILNDIEIISTKSNLNDNYKLSEININNPNNSTNIQRTNEIIKSQLNSDNSEDVISYANFKIV